MKRIRKVFVVMVLVVFGLVFYWFLLRPAQIRKGCWNQIEKIKSGETKSDKYSQEEFLIRYGVQKSIDTFYTNCLKRKGLEK